MPMSHTSTDLSELEGVEEVDLVAGEAGVTEVVVSTGAALVALPHHRTHMTVATGRAQVLVGGISVAQTGFPPSGSG